MSWLRIGSCDVFSALIGAKGRDVLYCGDHIYGDILKSKKIRGWRTFLIVPEMTHELYVWSARRDLHQRIHTLEARLNDAYLHMDSSSTTAPDTKDIHDEIQVRNITQLNLRYPTHPLHFAFVNVRLLAICDYVLKCPPNPLQISFHHHIYCS